jgi:hypothetical protein
MCCKCGGVGDANGKDSQRVRERQEERSPSDIAIHTHRHITLCDCNLPDLNLE